MQSAFTGTMSTVAIPFGCRVTSELPKLHRQVTNKSFGNRSAEGIYLYSDETPAIHMFLLSRKEVIVSDFLAYHDQFPSRHLHCLVHPSYTSTEIEEIHTHDTADDKIVSDRQQHKP